MNIRHLETFAAVVEKGSFSRAAQDLFTTPTALTQQVNALERSLGFPLLVRDWRGASPTPAGEVFYRYAVDIVRLARTAEQRAREVAGLGRPHLRIASYRDIELVLLQHVLAGFAQACPEVDVSFERGDYRGFLDALLAGSIDLYVHPWGSELDRDDLGFQKLGTTRLCCSMAFDHPLAGRASLRAADLAGYDVIVGCGCSSRSLDDFRSSLAEEAPQARIQSFETDDEVWTRVLTQGYLLVNMDYSAKYLGSCASVPFAGAPHVDYGFVYREPCLGAVRRLLDYAAAHGEDGEKPGA